MAQTTDSTERDKEQKLPRNQARSSCILGCFGRSSGGSLREEGEPKARSKWFPWSELKKIKSSPTRTVPIDGTADEKVHRKGSIYSFKSSKNLRKDLTQVPATEKIVDGKLPNKTKNDNIQETILINTKSTCHLDSIKGTTCRNDERFKIRKSTSLERISSPTWTQDKLEASRRKVAFSHSVSIPPPIRKKTVGEDSKANEEENYSNKNTDCRRFDQFVGMSIITVTLIIMVFWGKICAVLCTSIWFYFYPLVRRRVDEANVSKSGDQHDLDSNSQEYKRKVVLEGFLERNHRIR